LQRHPLHGQNSRRRRMASSRGNISTCTPLTWLPAHKHQMGTCQCTTCRKFTGSLVCQDISVPTAWISPSLDSQAVLKFYQSSKTAKRSFCSNCGSSIGFHKLEKPEETGLHVGSFDEEILVGEFGRTVCQPDGNLWCKNAVKGIGYSDELEGVKYETDRSSNVVS
jgi:hypothetical protein